MRRDPRFNLSDRHEPRSRARLDTRDMYRHMIRGRHASYRQAVTALFRELTGGCADCGPERLIIFQDMPPLDIPAAMGLSSWHPAMNDISPLPESRAMVAGNIFARQTKLPVHHVDVPCSLRERRGEDMLVKELFNMIAWLQEHTPGRMDWDRLKDICNQRNRQAALEHEVRQMNSCHPAALPGVAVELCRLYAPSLTSEAATRLWEEIHGLARENFDRCTAGFKDERHRCLFFIPVDAAAVDILVRCEQAWGITPVLGGAAGMHPCAIDTASEESMLRGIGRNMVNAPPAGLTRSPVKDFLRDTFLLTETMDIDMVMMAGGCPGTRGLRGIMSEQCREHGRPLCILDQACMNPRETSPGSIRSQIHSFMADVMEPGRNNQEVA